MKLTLPTPDVLVVERPRVDKNESAYSWNPSYTVRKQLREHLYLSSLWDLFFCTLTPTFEKLRNCEG